MPARRGHPRLPFGVSAQKGLDGRNKRGHDYVDKDSAWA
jgi:hypothetical protein